MMDGLPWGMVGTKDEPKPKRPPRPLTEKQRKRVEEIRRRDRQMAAAKVNFDKSYWPENGTVVPFIPADLNDLWDTAEGQAATFVAEALISDPPRSNVDLYGDGARIETFLWSIGGDTLTVEESLDELLAEANDFYDIIRSDEQAEDVESVIANLARLEETIKALKGKAEKMLEEFRHKSQ
jgi:hypothetical protein